MFVPPKSACESRRRAMQALLGAKTYQRGTLRPSKAWTLCWPISSITDSSSLSLSASSHSPECYMTDWISASRVLGDEVSRSTSLY